MFSIMKPGAAVAITGFLVLATSGADTLDQPPVPKGAKKAEKAEKPKPWAANGKGGK